MLTTQPLNRNQIKLAKEVVKCGDLLEAYMKTHKCTRVTARNAIQRYRKDPRFENKVAEYMKLAGLDKDDLAGKLVKMSNAKKEVLDKDGKVRKLVDNVARMNAIRTALEIHGELKTAGSVTINNTTDNRSVNITQGHSPETVSSLIKELRAMRTEVTTTNTPSGEIIDADIT